MGYTFGQSQEPPMATKPTMSPPSKPAPRFNPTATAIGLSLAFSVVLASLLTGNPLRAVQLAYMDYSRTPAADAARVPPANPK